MNEHVEDAKEGTMAHMQRKTDAPSRARVSAHHRRPTPPGRGARPRARVLRRWPSALLTIGALASLAGLARADDAASAKAALASARWFGPQRAIPAEGTIVRDDTGAELAKARRSLVLIDPGVVLDTQAGKTLLGVHGDHVRLAVWVDALALLVTRPVGIADSATGPAPAEGPPGVFLDPGAEVEVLERAHGRARVTVRETFATFTSGWIPEDAIGTTFLDRPAAAQGEAVLMGAIVIAPGRVEPIGGGLLRRLDGNLAELTFHRFRIVGTYQPPPAPKDDDNDGAVHGGVVADVPPEAPRRAGRPSLPAGTCLYSPAGAVIGELDGDGLTIKVARGAKTVEIRDWIKELAVVLTLSARRAPHGSTWQGCAP